MRFTAVKCLSAPRSQCNMRIMKSMLSPAFDENIFQASITENHSFQNPHSTTCKVRMSQEPSIRTTGIGIY